MTLNLPAPDPTANRRFVHFGANSTGKTFLDAIAILWLVYVRNTSVIALSPKED